MKLSVLYVEDDPNDAFFFHRAVTSSKLPVDVWTVTDGDIAVKWLNGEGIAAARDHYPKPDVLVLDLKLPRMNGFSVLEQIRRDRTLKDLSVVVYSSSLLKRDVSIAVANGASRFIGKTSDCAELLCHLKTLIALRSPARMLASPVATKQSAFA